MARGFDSDYIDLSLMGGFDFGFNFDGFEENVKKFMELPIRYLDSAHDKAVEFMEDVHDILYPPFPDDGVPDISHETFKDPSVINVIVESSPASVETELVGQSTEANTPPASIVTVEKNSMGCVDTDAQENTSPKGDQIKENDFCLLPEETSKTETCDSCTSEEVILWNPAISVESPQAPELTAESQDDHVIHAVDTDKVTEQVGLCCSGHSDIQAESSVCNGTILLEDSSAKFEQTVFHCANDPVEEKTQETISHDLEGVSGGGDDQDMWPHDMVNVVDMDLRDDQEHITDKKLGADEEYMKIDKFEDDQLHMKNDKIEASFSHVHQQKSKSLKKTFMRTLSSKLRWSKKQTDAQQTVPSTPRSQDPENHGYQVVSSPDDLEDGWELV